MHRQACRLSTTNAVDYSMLFPGGNIHYASQRIPHSARAPRAWQAINEVGALEAQIDKNRHRG
jgi:hypothetical protein